MYRKCTVDLVPKGVFRPPNAIGVNGEKQGYKGTKKPPKSLETPRVLNWLREPDLNRRPSGYEPDELPGCSIPRSAGNQHFPRRCTVICTADFASRDHIWTCFPFQKEMRFMTKLTIEGSKFCGSIVPEAFIVLINIPAKWHGTLAS